MKEILLIKKIDELWAEALKINKEGGFNNTDEAAAWLHEKVHPLAEKYDVEIGARMHKAWFKLDGNYQSRVVLGRIMTQYYSNGVSLTYLAWGNLNDGVAEWHSHGASDVTFTPGNDTDWADKRGAVAYVSRSPIGGYELDKYSKATGIISGYCKVKC